MGPPLVKPMVKVGRVAGLVDSGGTKNDGLKVGRERVRYRERNGLKAGYEREINNISKVHFDIAHDWYTYSC
jgi:hypothetical protein